MPTPAEVEMILQGKPVLIVFMGKTHPPMLLTTDGPT